MHGEGSALGRLYRQQEVGIKKSSSRVAVLVGFFGWMRDARFAVVFAASKQDGGPDERG